MNYLIALAMCGGAAIVEGMCAGRDPMAQLKATRQPSWSAPNRLWVLIGIAWYCICFIALARLIPFWPAHKAPVLLLAALMLANAGANAIQFRMKRLDLAFLWRACPLDGPTCALFALYAAYQIYAAAWGYRLWRKNPRTR